MEAKENVIVSNLVRVPFPRWLHIIPVIFSLISFYTIYIKGFDLYNVFYVASEWLLFHLLVIIIYKVTLGIRESRSRNSNSKASYLIVPWFIYAFPILGQVRFFVLFSQINVFQFQVLNVIAFSLLFYALIATILRLNNFLSFLQTIKIGYENIQQEASQSHEILGKGNTTIDRVIGSTVSRASSASKMIIVSLAMMVILVLIGGSASIGTLALNEIEKVRELEKEKQKMVSITMSMLNLRDSVSINTIAKERGAWLRISNKLKEINANSYDDLIKNSLREKNISWEDIAMRVTIAALTLFLVQIFFHIYKYSQQQESNLFAKAEILELYKDEDADKKDLRKGMLDKLEASVSFGKTPRTPTEQMLSALTSAKRQE
jgi:hypothetical protein